MPITYFANSLGSFNFNTDASLGSSCIATATWRKNYRERTAERPNIGGRYSAGSLFDSLSIDVEGLLRGVDATPAALRAAIDALTAAWPVGGSAQFKLDSDRYCNAEIRSFGLAESWKGLSYIKWAATLVSYDDPPWFDTASTVVSGLLVNGSANNFSVTGTGPAQPVMTLVVSAAPANSTITIVDQSGNIFVLSPDAAATFVIDSVLESVSAGGVDKSSFSTGPFPTCPIGANALTITLAGGATVSSASLSYQARWR